MRNLKSLGFRVPLVVVNKAHMANQIYPFAVSLIESVRMYERTCDKVVYSVSVWTGVNKIHTHTALILHLFESKMLVSDDIFIQD